MPHTKRLTIRQQTTVLFIWHLQEN